MGGKSSRCIGWKQDVLIIRTSTAVTGVRFSLPFACLSAWYLKNRSTKLDMETIHDESWNLIYFGVKKSKVKITSHKIDAGVGLCTPVSAGVFCLAHWRLFGSRNGNKQCLLSQLRLRCDTRCCFCCCDDTAAGDVVTERSAHEIPTPYFGRKPFTFLLLNCFFSPISISSSSPTFPQPIPPGFGFLVSSKFAYEKREISAYQLIRNRWSLIICHISYVIVGECLVQLATAAAAHDDNCRSSRVAVPHHCRISSPPRVFALPVQRAISDCTRLQWLLYDDRQSSLQRACCGNLNTIDLLRPDLQNILGQI